MGLALALVAGVGVGVARTDIPINITEAGNLLT